MKKLLIILGLVAAIIAVCLSASHVSNYAIIPIIVAFVSGLVLVILSRKQQSKIKPIQYIFLLVIISLGLTIYKGVFKSTETESTEQIDKQEENADDVKEDL